jgi:hypothetical protein
MWLAPSHDIPRRLLSAAERFEADGDELGTAMAIATAGLAEINTPDPDIPRATHLLEDGAARFRALGAGWGESLSLIALGRIAWLTRGLDEATELFRGALAAAESSRDRFTSTVATHHLARMLLFAGRLQESEELFRDAVDGSVGLRHEEGIAYGLEGLSAIAAVRGDAERAGVLAGAAATIRKRTAVFDTPAFVFHPGYIDELLRGDGLDPAEAAARESIFREAEERGRDYGAFEAASYVLRG